MKIKNDYKAMDNISDRELSIEKSKLRHQRRKDEKADRAHLETFSNIMPEPIEWLWQPRIAIAKLVIFAGDPGIGKSQGALYIAACISLGIPFHDGSPCQMGDTLILSGEDDPSDTIRPRLDALNADISRIHYVAGRITQTGSVSIKMNDIETFKDAIDQVRMINGNVRLLIIDPIESFLGGIDTNKNTEVREVLAEIIKLANDERFAIIAIQHLNKGNASAAYRVGGSIAFTAFSRSVWIFARDNRNPNRRLFLPLKNNLGADTLGFEYSIEKAANGSSRIAWGNVARDNIQDVLSSSNQSQTTISPEQEEVLSVLKEKHPSPMKTGEIAEQLQKQKSTVSNLLKKLKRSEKIDTLHYGEWQLSSSSADSSGLMDIHTDTGESEKSPNVSSLFSPELPTIETHESDETSPLTMNGGDHGYF